MLLEFVAVLIVGMVLGAGATYALTRGGQSPEITLPQTPPVEVRREALPRPHIVTPGIDYIKVRRYILFLLGF